MFKFERLMCIYCSKTNHEKASRGDTKYIIWRKRISIRIHLGNFEADIVY